MRAEQIKSNVRNIIDKYTSLEKNFDIILFIEAKHDISHFYLSISPLKLCASEVKLEDVIFQPSITVVKEVENRIEF